MLGIRPDLVNWQYNTYPANHRARTNLVIHIFAVPLCWVGLALIASFVLQGIGHRKERTAPVPFLGPIDFVSRFFVEQFVTFPRFVLSGGWFRSLMR